MAWLSSLEHNALVVTILTIQCPKAAAAARAGQLLVLAKRAGHMLDIEVIPTRSYILSSALLQYYCLNLDSFFESRKRLIVPTIPLQLQLFH